MHQSRTLYGGMDVPKESRAGAYVAQEHAAAVVSRGTFGPRQCDLDKLMRKLQAQAQPLVCGDAAGPWGSWL
jgi:hypothetical protein